MEEINPSLIPFASISPNLESMSTGSLFGKGCADATFTLQTALQTLQEHNHDMHVLLVDLVKAYDTVNRELSWKILKTFGVPPQMIRVIQKLYTDVTYHMNVAGKAPAE
jgi:hypothetical protein